jgi:hypothetical protein
VPQRLAPFAGGIERNFQPLGNFALADHIPHPLRAQNAIILIRHNVGWDNGSSLNNRLTHRYGGLQ